MPTKSQSGGPCTPPHTPPAQKRTAQNSWTEEEKQSIERLTELGLWDGDAPAKDWQKRWAEVAGGPPPKRLRAGDFSPGDGQ